MQNTKIDIIDLAKSAHLERLIERNTVYLERRRRNFQNGRFDIQVADDNEALAVAIILLEGMG